ncbi:MAG: hypothetical protein AB7P35_17835 [Hyphomonadaceae bacterium]
MSYICPDAWKLTPQEARFVALLVEAQHGVCAADLWERIGTHAEPQVVKVLCSRVRAKLKRFGVEIVTEYGRGYRIEAPARRALLDGAVSVTPEEQAA